MLLFLRSRQKVRRFAPADFLLNAGDATRRMG